MYPKPLQVLGLAAILIAISTPLARADNPPTRCVLTLETGRAKKPLTPRQAAIYKDLRSIGITKKDAAQVARDPGVKKGEWGWTRVGGASEGVMCVKNEGSERLMKYRNNVVIE
jgi:hypothetical protein